MMKCGNTKVREKNNSFSLYPGTEVHHNPTAIQWFMMCVQYIVTPIVTRTVPSITEVLS